jgi:hypothetical protein
VIYLIPNRTGAEEGSGNQTVNKEFRRMAVDKLYLLIPIIVFIMAHYVPPKVIPGVINSVQAPNATLVTNFVTSFISRYVFPNLFHL